VAEALIEKEVEYIFTLSGGHITPIYQYLENLGITLFDTRHEQAAAWGKMTSTPGVAMVTAGPGFTNCLTGIASSFFSNTPLVLISGCVGLCNKERLDLQDMPQEAVISPMVKKTLVCHSPERIFEYVDMAFRHATGGRPGPVYLEFPVDVLNANVERDAVRHVTTAVDSRPADHEGARAMLEMMGKAEKPVVIAGSGVWQSDAGEALTSFIERTGMPVFTSLTGRGTIADDHPLCFEGALAIRPGAAFAAYLETDLVIVLRDRDKGIGIGTCLLCQNVYQEPACM
jgi:acetolactate synthase-1/2/3 large subunit